MSGARGEHQSRDTPRAAWSVIPSPSRTEKSLRRDNQGRCAYAASVVDGQACGGRGGFKWGAGAALWTFALFLAAAFVAARWPSWYGIGQSRAVPFLGGLVVVCLIETWMLRLSEARGLHWARTVAWGCLALTCAAFMFSALSLAVFLAPTLALVIGGMVRWDSGKLRRPAP